MTHRKTSFLPLVLALSGIAILLLGSAALFRNDGTNTLHVVIGAAYIFTGAIFMAPSLNQKERLFNTIVIFLTAVWAAAELLIAQDYTVASSIGLLVALYWNASKRDASAV